jgi:hypothetical protein
LGSATLAVHWAPAAVVAASEPYFALVMLTASGLGSGDGDGGGTGEAAGAGEGGR